jgi:hypothetical protein
VRICFPAPELSRSAPLPPEDGRSERHLKRHRVFEGTMGWPRCPERHRPCPSPQVRGGGGLGAPQLTAQLLKNTQLLRGRVDGAQGYASTSELRSRNPVWTSQRQTAMNKLRIVTLWIPGGDRSRGRFATPADFPLRDCRPYSHVNVRCERLGFVRIVQGPFSVAPRKSVTIHHFPSAVRPLLACPSPVELKRIGGSHECETKTMSCRRVDAGGCCALQR